MPNGKSGQRLDSWKDIAAYLGRDVRTVIRWEKEKGLPIHRVPGGRRQSVFAYPEELDRWLDSGLPIQQANSPVPGEHSPIVPSSDLKLIKAVSFSNVRGRVAVLALVLLTIAVLSAGAILLLSHRPNGTLSVVGFRQLTDDGGDKTGLVTNGSQVFFAERRSGRYVLAMMPIDGGPIRTIQSPFANATPIDISSDGQNLLVLAYRGYEDLRELWIVPLGGGVPHRVGTILCQSAVWSPSADAIIYAAGKDLYLTADDGETSEKILTAGSAPFSLRWSPDGRHLRFMTRDIGTDAAWSAELSENRPISPPRLVAKGFLSASWSRSNRDDKYFLCAFAVQSGCSIVLTSEGHDGETNNQIRLPIPDDVARMVTSIATDPFKDRIFFLSKDPRLFDLFQISQSSNALMPFLPGLHGEYLDFSKDGRWLVYMSAVDGFLWTSRSDGSDAHRLDSQSQFIQLPRFSPDASMIAYMSKRAGRPWRIWLVPREGGTPREASVGNDSQGAPTWSPDGKYLVYGEVDCQETNSCAVYRVELSSGRIERINGSDGLSTARWSPDGRFIAALRTPAHELWLFSLKTQQWKKLSDQITGNDLSWSHDSRFIYASRERAANPEIVRLSIDGGQEKVAAALGPLVALSGEISPWFCLAPDDSVIALRRTRTAEIYSLSWTGK